MGFSLIFNCIYVKTNTENLSIVNAQGQYMYYCYDYDENI